METEFGLSGESPGKIYVSVRDTVLKTFLGRWTGLGLLSLGKTERCQETGVNIQQISAKIICSPCSFHVGCDAMRKYLKEKISFGN